MTRERAEELVWDLIDAYSNKCLYHSTPSFVEEFESIRERIVNHLASPKKREYWAEG